MVTKRKSETPGDSISATVSSDALRRAVKTLDEARVGAGFASIPILTCIVLAAGPDGVRAEYRGTDLTVEIDVEGNGSGCLALPARPLRAFLDSVTSETVDIKKEEGDSRAGLTAGRMALKVVAMSVADTPVRKAPRQGEREFALAEGVLDSLMRYVIPFISTEETRYYLNGVSLEIEGKTLAAVATDGHRLAKRQTTLGASIPDMESIIVPRNVCKLALSAIGEAEVDVRVSDKAIRFSAEGVSIDADLISGTFPNWRRVVPAVGEASFTFNGKDAGRFLASAMRMTKNRDKAVALTPGEGASLSLSFQAIHDNVDQFATVIAATVKGQPQRIGANGKYLAGLIRLLGGGDITINQSEKGDGSSYTGAVRISSDKGQEGDVIVLMPMRV